MSGYTNLSRVLVSTGILSTIVSPSEVIPSHPVSDSPRLSTYGQKITVFSSTRKDNNNEIYVMDLDKQIPKRLTNNKKDDYHPTISPVAEGSNLVVIFYRDLSDNKSDIIRIEGGTEKVLLSGGRNYTSPQGWSPDGKQFAFISDREDGAPRVYLTDPNFKKEPTRLTDGPDMWASWSPDGKKIAYIRLPTNKPNGIADFGILRVKEPITGRDYQLTNTNNYKTPVWINNDEIVVAENFYAWPCLTLLNVKTGRRTPITRPDSKMDSPPSNPNACSYDVYPYPISSYRVAFVRLVDSWKIFSINVDGTDLEMLTGKGNNLAPNITTRDDQLNLGLEKHLFTEQNGLLTPSYHGFTHWHLDKNYRFMPLSVPHWDVVNQSLLQVP